MADTSPGLLRRSFSTLWRWIDGTRRAVFNLLFVALIAALLLLWLNRGPAAVKEHSALVLDLSGALVEQASGSARDQAWAQVKGQAQSQIRLRDVLAALDAAAKDSRIDSVLLMLDDLGPTGLPSLREVAAAITRYRASGKKVLAWAGHYDQRAYFVAAHADEVLLHPMGIVHLQGYGSLRNYYLDAFDRLGVKAHVIRAGKFKNFGEGYVANGPSVETQAADKSLYDALWRLYTEGVETARKLSPGSVVRALDGLPQALVAAGNDPAQWALNAKLIDGLKTRDELRALMIERGAADAAAKSFRQIGLGAYLATLQPKTSGDAVAVVVAQGGISDDQAAPGAIGGRSTAELIRQARQDEAVKAVVLRVNSPGGSAYGSELIRRELELTRAAGKPVVVSMGDVAASGGYWIAMAADEVIADAATITGSIGVFAILPTAAGLVDKLSLHTGGYSTHWLAQGYDPRKALDPRFAALVQSGIDSTYSRFTTLAAAARKTTPEKIDAVAQGRVWTGAQALAHGLIDRTGSFGDALKAAGARAKLAEGHRVSWIERPPGKWDRVLGLLGGAGFAAWLQPLWDAEVRAQGGAATLGSTLGSGFAATALAALPALAGPLPQDALWLAELSQQRAPYAAIVHCLCTPP